MDYNTERMERLAGKYFRGESTLAEEAALREILSGCEGLPAELEACRLMLCAGGAATETDASAETALENPLRPLALHTAVRKPLRRWMVAASGVAAVAVALTALLVGGERFRPGDVVCYVDGRLITDRNAVREHTLRAFDVINANLQKPLHNISSEMEGSPAMGRVGEMFDALVAGSESGGGNGSENGN